MLILDSQLHLTYNPNDVSPDQRISRQQGRAPHCLIATKGNRFNDLKLEKLLQIAESEDISIDSEEDAEEPNRHVIDKGKKHTACSPDDDGQYHKKRNEGKATEVVSQASLL